MIKKSEKIGSVLFFIAVVAYIFLSIFMGEKTGNPIDSLDHARHVRDSAIFEMSRSK